MRRYIVIVLAFFFLLSAGVEHAGAQVEPRRAPESGRVDRGTGFVRPALDLAHVAPPAVGPAKAALLPARLDWRESGVVSPPKDQGSCGACYAFAAAGDVESRILRDFGLTADLSENFLKECHFEGRSCSGGNASMVMNLLTRTGAVLEDCDPYVAADVACNLGCAAQYAVLDWVWLSGSTLPATDDLKQALIDHGPLSTTVYAGDESNTTFWSEFSSWNGGDGLYHVGTEETNHAVMIVGWDDDQPHGGGGTGCWIVKNSWNDTWGDACDYGSQAGYFYIAYGSAGIGKWSSAVVEIMPTYPDLAVHGWDEGGWTSAYGYGQPEAWGLARFDADSETKVHRVEFWTTDATEDVDVFIYDGFNGTSLSGLLASVENLDYASSGYHSVPLPDPLLMIPGDDYYVAVRFQNASYTYPVAVDGQSARSSGHTWLSYDGSSWNDLGSDAACEAGIRIRTSPYTTLAADSPDTPDLPPTPDDGSVFELAQPWPNPFNPSTMLSFDLGRAASVRLCIYDLEGRLVRSLLDEYLTAGQHSARWDGRSDAGRIAPAGIYLCRLEDGWQSRSRRVVLVK